MSCGIAFSYRLAQDFNFPSSAINKYVYCMQFAYREISIHTLIYWYVFDFESTLDSPPSRINSTAIQHTAMFRLRSCRRMCTTRKSVSITDIVQRVAMKKKHAKTLSRWRMIERTERKKEKSVYRHCANGMKQRIHMWSVWVAHIFFRIDFFNHIVNAKKIIIQNEWYWVTICARAEGWKGTQTNQASTAHLNRSNIKRNTHTRRNRNLYQSLLHFSIVLISRTLIFSLSSGLSNARVHIAHLICDRYSKHFESWRRLIWKLF